MKKWTKKDGYVLGIGYCIGIGTAIIIYFLVLNGYSERVLPNNIRDDCIGINLGGYEGKQLFYNGRIWTIGFGQDYTIPINSKIKICEGITDEMGCRGELVRFQLKGKCGD